MGYDKSGTRKATMISFIQAPNFPVLFYRSVVICLNILKKGFIGFCDQLIIIDLEFSIVSITTDVISISRHLKEFLYEIIHTTPASHLVICLVFRGCLNIQSYSHLPFFYCPLFERHLDEDRRIH